ncbi:MAG: hypothetical protein WD972_02645 [Candidatus Andersenbacteria bacterium]
MPRSKSKNEGDQPATQHDLELWGNQLSLQVNNIEARLTKKIEDMGDRMTGIEGMGDKIMKHIDAALENRASDVLGVTSDEVKLIKDNTENHEERIVTLEKHAGVR